MATPTTPREVLAIQHVPQETLGWFAPTLARAGFAERYFLAPESLPTRDEVLRAPLLVVLGGPMGVYEAQRYPFLREERDLIAARLDSDQPCLGVCLGAQVIAKALGAHVERGPRFELGFGPVTLTDSGRASCLAELGASPVLHWHGDTYELPRGATRLASSAMYVEQGYSIGDSVLALQFHLEAGGPEFAQWIDESDDELSRAGVEADSLRQAAIAAAPLMA
ncbi:MAG TPA: glutamine amidotransferase, partial [Rhodanobacteraceae bacterium]